MSLSRTSLRTSLIAAGCAALMAFGAGTASAATQVSWTGATPAANGKTFLHNSTITNDGGLFARTKIWSVTGAQVPAFDIAARARLFKSGIICQVVEFTYNTDWASQLEISTDGANCGTGSYNSHGYVRTFDNSAGYRDYFTFPTNPIDFVAPAARSAAPEGETPAVESFTVDGQTFGPADPAKPDTEQPTFVAAYTDSGEQGYIRSADLITEPVDRSAAEQLQKDGSGQAHTPSRQISVYSEDGATQIGVLSTL